MGGGQIMKLAKERLKQIIKEELTLYNKKGASKSILVKEFFRKEKDLAGKVEDLIRHIEKMDLSSLPPSVQALLDAAEKVQSEAGGMSVVSPHMEPGGVTVLDQE